MSERVFQVLFLCTGNSARSIMAESILREIGAGRFVAFSAGSQPKGGVHPIALELLTANRLPTTGLRSKGWDESAAPGAPNFDFVITVCDNAAGEVCPVWPGQPANAHWGVPDPAAVEGNESDRRRAFADVYRILTDRIRLFTRLPFATLDRKTLLIELDGIGRSP